MAVLWLTTTLVAAVAADFKVFRANRCNTNAEVERNWFGARGIAVPTADDDGSGSGDAPGSAAFPATVRFGHQLQGGAADAPSSFVPVDVLFGQDSVSGFGEMIFEPDAAVTFEDGARWEIGDDAAGDDVVFIGGQLRDTACDVSCHRNWFDLQDPRAHDPYRTDLLADGGPGIPAVEVPCSRDSAWFPPEYHSALDTSGTVTYGVVRYQGPRFGTVPDRFVRRLEPGTISNVTVESSQSLCLEGRGMAPFCVCPSTCRDEDDPLFLADLARVRSGAVSKAQQRLAATTPQPDAADPPPPPPGRLPGRRTLYVGGSLPQLDLELMVGPANRGPFSEHLEAGLVNRTDLWALDISAVTTTWDLTVSAAGPQQRHSTGWATHPIAAMVSFQPADMTSPAAWARIQAVAEDLVASYVPLAVLPRCSSLEAGVSDDCIDRELESYAVELRARVLPEHIIAERLRLRYPELRGCSPYELVAGNCAEAAASTERRGLIWNVTDDIVLRIRTTTTPPRPRTRPPKQRPRSDGSSSVDDEELTVWIIAPAALAIVAAVCVFGTVLRRNRAETLAHRSRINAGFTNPTYLKEHAGGAQRVAQLVSVDVDSDDEADAPTYGEYADVTVSQSLGGKRITRNDDESLHDTLGSPPEEGLYEYSYAVADAVDAGDLRPGGSTDPTYDAADGSGGAILGRGKSVYEYDDQASAAHAARAGPAIVYAARSDLEGHYSTGPSAAPPPNETYSVSTKTPLAAAAPALVDEALYAPETTSAGQLPGSGRAFTESNKAMERKASVYDGFVEVAEEAAIEAGEQRVAPEVFAESTKTLGRNGSVYDGFSSHDDEADPDLHDGDLRISQHKEEADPNDGYLKVGGLDDGC